MQLATKGEERMCSTCNEFAEVMELIPNGDGWYIQKLSCGHTGRIKIMDPIVEKVEIKDEVKNVTTKFSYGQVTSRKKHKGFKKYSLQVWTQRKSA